MWGVQMSDNSVIKSTRTLSDVSQTKITSLDVAKLAGVSQSAVSRVFTQGASASAKTAEKVQNAAKKLGYRPNRIARSLLTGRSYMIGLVVAYLDNYFYPEIVERLSNALQKEGYHVLIFMAAQTANNVDKVVEEILEYQIDAIVTASVAFSSELTTKCENAGIPVLQFNRVQRHSSFASVTSDNYHGGSLIAQHLINEGYRSFGYIAGWEGASTQRDREAGFCRKLNDYGFDISARAVGNFRSEQSREAALSIMKTTKTPEAVFVANDAMALIVMDVFRFELGLSIPEDIGVVGYDDVPPARLASYDLTTVSQPVAQMVEQTVLLIMKYMQDEPIQESEVKLPGKLIIRSSTRKKQYQK